jgi:hypothetical protein
MRSWTPEHWRRVALIIAKQTARDVGLDTSMRMLEGRARAYNSALGYALARLCVEGRNSDTGAVRLLAAREFRHLTTASRHRI